MPLGFKQAWKNHSHKLRLIGFCVRQYVKKHQNTFQDSQVLSRGLSQATYLYVTFS